MDVLEELEHLQIHHYDLPVKQLPSNIICELHKSDVILPYGKTV